MSEMGNELATMGSAAAGRGQFRCCLRSVVLAKVGRWLAFCRYGKIELPAIFLLVDLYLSVPRVSIGSGIAFERQ